MWELSSPVLRLTEARGWTSQWECVILRRPEGGPAKIVILSINEKQVESRWVTCSKISRGSGSVRMWESQGGRQRVASGRPTGRTISPGSLTWPRPRRLRFSTQACHNFSDRIWLGEGKLGFLLREQITRSPGSLTNHEDSAFKLVHVTSLFPY